MPSLRAKRILLGVTVSSRSRISRFSRCATSHKMGGGSGLELPQVLGCFHYWEGGVLTL